MGDLLLAISISSILSFRRGHPVAAYIFLLVFPLFQFFHLSFIEVSQKAVPTQDVTIPVSLLFL
jgi:hypothetical protein